MSETVSRLPEEDRPQIRPDELRDREQAGGSGTSSAGTQPGASGGTPATGSSKSANLGRTSGSGKSGGSTSSAGFLKSGEENPSSSYFNSGDNQDNFFSRGKASKKARLSKRNKIIAVSLAGIISAVVGLSTFFFMGIFNLPNFVKNIEQAGFQRYQVDITGRSSKWLEAYMDIRFGEVEDPNLAPNDRDNVFFRADRVDNDKPLTDWYRTMRASKFEEQLFEQDGIRFTSMAEKRGNSIVYRPAVISFKDTDKQITFDPGQATFDAMARGDPNAFNGALSDFVQKNKVFETDKDARAEIAKIVKEKNPNWWKAIKRYHLRQDIQNMIGVRKWTFFENTRNTINEKKISYRNKLITQALPDDSKTGDFIKCLFGIPDCKSSTDPGNESADDHSPTGSQKEGDKTDGDPKNPQPLSDGSAEGTLEDAASVAKSGAGDLAGRIASKLIAKAGIFSMLDSLARFDQALNQHKLSKIITQAKSMEADGYFSVFEVASDQLTTGQQNSSEINAFMKQFQHPTNNEGWTSVIDPQNGLGSVFAASNDYVVAKDKTEFCSDKHQAEMKAHPAQAENEFQWQCPANAVGSVTRGQELEDAWNGGPGAILHPLLSVYHQATGGIFDVFNSITSAITDPVINAALAATGQTANLENAVASVATAALQFGGDNNLGITEDSPSGGVAMAALQGSAVQGEASMRDQGAALTTPDSRKTANDAVTAYESEQQHTNSFYTRYVSPSNPQSLFATEFFAITTNFNQTGRNLLGVFADAISNPLKALTQPAHAAVPNGYGASKFAGIETYDFPKECLNSAPLDETPQSVTNADDLGYFKPSDLTWDLVNNRDAWYKALYDKVGGDEDKAKQVWNCALLDNTVRGGMSAQYGYAGENAYQSSAGQQGDGDTTGTTPGTVSGTSQQLAQDILNNKNVTYQFSAETDVKLAAQGKNGTNGYPLDIRLLQIVDALAQNHQVNVSAFESYGQGHSTGSDHYTGHAVDIASIDGVPAYQNITKFWDEISAYSKDAVFLQGQCSGDGPTPKGMTRLSEDVCTHQHISVDPPS